MNTYTFAPDEQLVSCCSCRVTRNAFWSLAVQRDLLSNTLTPSARRFGCNQIACDRGPASGSCNPATPGPTVQGLAAWGTTLHRSNGVSGRPYGTETPFTNSTLSTAEQDVMTSYCSFIQSNGSGYGICRACQMGHFGLGENDPSHNTGLGGAKAVKILPLLRRFRGSVLRFLCGTRNLVLVQSARSSRELKLRLRNASMLTQRPCRLGRQIFFLRWLCKESVGDRGAVLPSGAGKRPPPSSPLPGSGTDCPGPERPSPARILWMREVIPTCVPVPTSPRKTEVDFLEGKNWRGRRGSNPRPPT